MSTDYYPVSTSNQSNLYTLRMGRIKMVIDGAVGARIIEFSYDGTNVLTGPAVNPTNYGSTFWTSPQSTWNWPPVAAIDNSSYSGSADSASNSIQLVSGVASVGGAQITVKKRFVAVPASGAIDVTYTLTNAPSSVTLAAAPWEISRVAGSEASHFSARVLEPTQPPVRSRSRSKMASCGTVLLPQPPIRKPRPMG